MGITSLQYEEQLMDRIAELEARVAELEAENERLKRELRAANKGAERNIKVAEAVTHTNMELKDENERLREALSWYALHIPANYEIYADGKYLCKASWLSGRAIKALTADGGAKARAALEGKG